MSYSDRMQKSHLYSVYFAPRGYARMADLGMQIAQQYLSPFDQIIGVVGEAGSGKSMLIKGMFPGLELTNDDAGVNVRPLPIMDLEDSGFYAPHTYHVDIRFESAFYQMHQLADAIREAVSRGKRVIVEHFDLVYEALGQNAHLLIGVGEEIIINRPNLFGPEPGDVFEIVAKSVPYRKMTHTAEDLCGLYLKRVTDLEYTHADVRHGFILSFKEKPEGIDLNDLEKQVNDMIEQDIPISFLDDQHILIGEYKFPCSGPRMHVRSTGEIKRFALIKEFLAEPVTGRYLLVGVVGEQCQQRLSDLNKFSLL